MKFHKHSLIALSTALALVTVSGVAGAQSDPARKTIEIPEARGGSSVVAVVGEVTAVDPANRIVSIKGPKGNVADMKVDDRVKNFDQIKVGDRVRISYRVGIALALMKGGDGIREKVETEATGAAEKGAKPGAIAVKRTTVVADVEAIDKKKKIATLKGTNGQLVDVRVRDAQTLHDVKVGDQVIASVTESVAVRVQPAK